MTAKATEQSKHASWLGHHGYKKRKKGKKKEQSKSGGGKVAAGSSYHPYHSPISSFMAMFDLSTLQLPVVPTRRRRYG